MLNPEIWASQSRPIRTLPASKPQVLFIAGQVGTDKDGKTPAPISKGNARRYSPTSGPRSLRRAQASANVVEFTSYLVHSQDIAKLLPRYRTREFPRLFAGGAYPPNTLLIVDRLGARGVFARGRRRRRAVAESARA